MKLRVILLLLSLLAFLSAATGGYLYYSSLQKSAFQEAERQAIMHAERIKKNLASFLSANIRPAKALAGMRERAGLVGGVLEVQSQPGKGTRVNFIVPVDGQAGAAQ